MLHEWYLEGHYHICSLRLSGECDATWTVRTETIHTRHAGMLADRAGSLLDQAGRREPVAAMGQGYRVLTLASMIVENKRHEAI